MLHLPEAPYHARLDDFGDLWMPKIFQGGLGLIFFTIGCASFSRRDRGSRDVVLE